MRTLVSLMIGLGIPGALGVFCAGAVLSFRAKPIHNVTVVGSLATHHVSFHSTGAVVSIAGLVGVLWALMTIFALWVAFMVYHDSDWRKP